jgi:phosphoheptose isomerase
VGLAEVDPRNASAIEMFAFCQYADENGTGVNDHWGSWHALKEFTTPFGKSLEYSSLDEAATKKRDWSKALSQSKYSVEKKLSGEILSAADVFQMLKDTTIEEHKLATDETKTEAEQCASADAQWDELIENIDSYMDDFKKELNSMEKIKEETIVRAVADAPADMRAMASSNSMRKVKINMLAETDPDDEDDDSAITNLINTIQMDDIMSKSQELELTGDTSVGISTIGNEKECASVSEDKNKNKIWTITAFTEQGIACNQIKDGETKELWEIDYQNPDDAGAICEFLDKFSKDDDLEFASEQEFWEDFLAL